MAYASFCVYLFHRPIWKIMADVWPEHSFAQWLFIIPFGITLIFVVSYYTQLIYDKIVEKFESK
jgi:peptidoglycan/LPS O-acetylase OafA/YrhL